MVARANGVEFVIAETKPRVVAPISVTWYRFTEAGDDETDGPAYFFKKTSGTTYPANLRLVLSKMDEAEFVRLGHEVKTRPPMPWYSLHAMTDDELRSFYQYVKSLGSPGEPVPDYVKPGEAPKTPFIVFAPPQMPAQ